MNIPVELKNAICENKLIVFVGAGLSYNLLNTQGKQLKGWSNLVENILYHLKELGHKEANLLLPLVGQYEPIDILNLIESNKVFQKNDIYPFMKDFLDVENDQNDFSLHEKVSRLSNKIISTNYDTAFENASPFLKKNTAYKGKNYELIQHKKPNSKFLFKLHGCYLSSDSMVLFPSNYDDLYNNPEKDAEHSLLVLKNIVMNNSLLFIGTGMGDFQVNNIFKEIQRLQGEYNQKHFITTNKHLDSSLNFLTPIFIKEYSEIDTVIEELLNYKSNCKDEDSEKIKVLEEQLKDAEKRIYELENKTNRNQEDLLEEEALKYFSKGLEYSLDSDYERAIIEYKRSTELKPAFHEAYNNWGTTLGNLAKTKQGEQAEQLYQSAFEKFQKAIEIKPDKHEAYNNWGTDLGNLAKTKQGEHADQLYQSAFEKYQKAIEIKPDKHEAYNNWGTVLGNLAKTKQGEYADQLYQSAFEKYQKAIEIKPDKHEAFYNWGTDLGNLAKTKQGEHAEQLYQSTFEKFQKAIEIKPDKHKAYNNWGNSLRNLAKTKQGEQAEELYKVAFEKFEEGIEYGGSSYNLSCLYAIRGKKNEALIYLKKSLENNEITANFVSEDEDWKDYLEDLGFLEIIDKFK